MSILAVDLAAKFSAACWMSDLRVPLYQWDSWQRTETAFIDVITGPWSYNEQPPIALVLEDLPARVPWMSVVKDVCRLQGRIVERMNEHGYLAAVVFVQPAQWRAHFDGMGQGTGPDVVVPVAETFGYIAPDLTSRVGKGEKATARKVATDYCAAYLIARWATDYYAVHGDLRAPRTTTYAKS